MSIVRDGRLNRRLFSEREQLVSTRIKTSDVDRGPQSRNGSADAQPSQAAGTSQIHNPRLFEMLTILNQRFDRDATRQTPH